MKLKNSNSSWIVVWTFQLRDFHLRYPANRSKSFKCINFIDANSSYFLDYQVAQIFLYIKKSLTLYM